MVVVRLFEVFFGKHHSNFQFGLYLICRLAHDYADLIMITHDYNVYAV